MLVVTVIGAIEVGLIKVDKVILTITPAFLLKVPVKGTETVVPARVTVPVFTVEETLTPEKVDPDGKTNVREFTVLAIVSAS